MSSIGARFNNSFELVNPDVTAYCGPATCPIQASDKNVRIKDSSNPYASSIPNIDVCGVACAAWRGPELVPLALLQLGWTLYRRHNVVSPCPSSISPSISNTNSGACPLPTMPSAPSPSHLHECPIPHFCTSPI